VHMYMYMHTHKHAQITNKTHGTFKVIDIRVKVNQTEQTAE